jgi:hypothetical protein
MFFKIQPFFYCNLLSGVIDQDMLLEQKIARLRQSFKRLHRRRRADPFDDEGFLRMQKELKIIAKEMLKEKYKLLREKQRVIYTFLFSFFIPNSTNWEKKMIFFPSCISDFLKGQKSYAK